jgi:hypothetical protein
MEVKYLPREVVRGEIHTDTVFVMETLPLFPVLPLIPDTIYHNDTIYITQRVDTSAIIADYVVNREYTPVLFDSPTQGKLRLSTIVQYNKLQDLHYEFTPILREVTKYRIKIWQPFLGISYNTLGETTLSAGMFYNSLGIELLYARTNTPGCGIGVKYLF